MNITWFHSHFLNFNSGGTRFVFDYCDLLKKNHNHKITIVCDVASTEAINKAKSSKIKIVQLDQISTNSLIYWITLRLRILLKKKKLNTLVNNCDLVISSMFPMNLLVSNLKIPKVQICYEPYAFFYDHHFLKNYSIPVKIFFRMMSLFYSSIDKQSVQKMNQVFTVNEKSKENIYKTYGVLSKKTYAGINNKLYKKIENKKLLLIKKKYSGHPLLFHSTDLTGIKGTFYFLETIKILKKTYPKILLLVTVYIKNQNGIKKLLKTIKDLGLKDNVKYIGCLETKVLPKYYNSVDFVCQPSLNQPASWPLKESLSCGTPIIGGPESEEVIDFVNGIKIDPRNINESVNKIIKVMNNKSKLKVNNKEIVNNYSSNKCVSKFNDQLLKIYEIYKN